MIASGFSPNGAPAPQRSSTSSGAPRSGPDNAHRSDDRSNSPGVATLRNRLANRLYAKFGAAVMVPLYLSISLAHNNVSRRKSMGVTLTSSAPMYIGTVR